jgi:hypothetical protein
VGMLAMANAIEGAKVSHARNMHSGVADHEKA